MTDKGLDALLGDVGFFQKDNPTRITRRYRSDRFRSERLAWGWMPAHPAFFLRKELVQRVGQFNSSYRIAGDFEYIVRVFHGKTPVYQHKPEVMVLMQVGGVSTNGWRSKILLNREVIRACKENGLRTNWFMVLSKYVWKVQELLPIERIDWAGLWLRVSRAKSRN